MNLPASLPSLVIMETDDLRGDIHTALGSVREQSAREALGQALKRIDALDQLALGAIEAVGDR